MLYCKANEDGLNLRDMALALDVTYGYIHQLKTGIRNIPQVSDEFLLNCARFLKKPRSYVMALSEKRTFADDYVEDSLDGNLDSALSLMFKDTKWGGYLPLSMKSLGRKERLFIVKLYEAATGKLLLPGVEMESAA